MSESLPVKYIGLDNKKHAKCPFCGRDWLTGHKGGGMVYQAAMRHVASCQEKNNTVQASMESKLNQ